MNCARSPGWIDMQMMAANSACERTEKQFRQLFVSVGFWDVKFSYPAIGIDGAVEAIL